MGVSHAADGSAALAPAQRSRSERALVQSAQRGDPGAVEELYRRHWRQAYRAAYLVTRDAHAAEDIAQEAFLQAIRVLDRFDRARPFAPWLHRIVTNRALDWARAHALRRPAEAAHEAVAPEARSDLSDDLAEAIGRLAPDARAVIVLRYLLEHTPGEIAEMLDLPRGTVNSRLRRALDELAGEVDRERPTSSAEGPPAGLRGTGRDRGRRARAPPRARGLRRAHPRAAAARRASADRLAGAGGAARRRRRRGRRLSALPGARRARSARRSACQVQDGVVLVLGRGVASTVNAHGRVRALGPASDGDLSPHARNAVLASGSASSPSAWPTVRCAGGCPHAAPSPCRAGRSSAPCRPAAGWRISPAGRSTRSAVTAAAHTSSRAHALAVAPAWRPGGDGHELAFAAPGGIRVVGRRQRRGIARVRGPALPLALSWRADGRSLAVLDAAGATLYSATGSACSGCRARGPCSRAASRLPATASSCSGATTTGRLSLLVRGASGPLHAVRHLRSRPPADLRLSPDGSSALIASREATNGSRSA